MPTKVGMVLIFMPFNFAVSFGLRNSWNKRHTNLKDFTVRQALTDSRRCEVLSGVRLGKVCDCLFEICIIVANTSSTFGLTVSWHKHDDGMRYWHGYLSAVRSSWCHCYPIISCFITRAIGSRYVGGSSQVSGICDVMHMCVGHCLKEKQLKLSTPNLVDIQCVAVAQYALTLRSKSSGSCTAGMGLHVDRTAGRF